VAAQAAAEIHGALRAVSLESAREQPLNSGAPREEGRAILNASFLVAPARVVEFQRALTAMVNKYEPSGFKVDFTGPGSWSAQAALWVKIPGAPVLPPIPGMPVVGLVAAAVIGAILLAAGLKVGVAMPPIPKPKLELPMLPLPPEMLLKLALPQLAIPPLPILDQPKLMKLLFPFIDLGKGICIGSIKCC
jgi:hypothetical protein